MFEINSQIFLISTCACFMASNITSLGISSAPASIITIFSLVPATVKWSLDSLLCSSVGLIINSLFIYPTWTAAVGPPQGISEIDNAADVPIFAHTSGDATGSTDSTVLVTHTSFLKSAGNKGLIGLSIALDTKIALSDGFPSLLLKLPGILPTAYSFSS